MADSVKIAVIGLGSMGLGMAQSLLREGFSVSGCDVNPAALETFARAGGTIGNSAADAAQNADIVITVVVNAAQTATVLFGEKGAAPAMTPGGAVISCATMAPDSARELATKIEGLGLLYLDAPISGGALKAADGQLTVMASGSRAAFARARSALDAIAATVHELGDEPGLGASFKIVNQLLAGVHIAAACEAITFAKRLGLDLDRVYKVITGSAGNSWMFENRIPHVLEGDYRPRSAVDIFTKDLGIVGDIGRSTKFPMPMAATALQLFLATAAAGMGRDDDASVARLIAQMTGLDLPKPSPEA
ncbi:MAG: L-threonate dehydrogenase [Parvibaculaceae bacterium]